MKCNDYFKLYKKQILVYIVMQFLRYGVLLLPSYCYYVFLNEIIIEHRIEKIVEVLLLYLFIYMLKSIMTFCVKMAYNNIFPKINAGLKDLVIKKIDEMDLIHVHNFSAGELKERVQRDTENISIFLEKKIDMWISIAYILVSAIILINLNWILALSCFILLPLSFWLTNIIKSKSNVEHKKKRALFGVFNDFMINSMLYWKEIKSSGLGIVLKQDFEKIWENIGQASFRAHMFWFMNRTFLAFKDVFLTKMSLYLVGGILIIKEISTIPILLSFMEYYSSFINRLIEVIDIFVKQGEQEEAIKRVDELLKEEAKEDKFIISCFQNLQLKDIKFSYQGEKDYVIKNFNMELRRGECVAITGESGCGKSTLIKLLAGYIAPQAGKIIWNGYLMNDVSLKGLYRKVGFLMQESKVFNLSIRENLLLGNEKASEDELVEACQNANILAFIQALPDGFETQIGENGVCLSGGQKQRLLIARMFLQDPDVIVLDEATSALDYDNESEILDLLFEKKGEKTLLIVTHRQTSLGRCNKVIALDKCLEKAYC